MTIKNTLIPLVEPCVAHGKDSGRQQSSMGDDSSDDDTALGGGGAGAPSRNDGTSTPPRKKKKRMQKYREEWEKENSWVGKVQDNEYKANCTVCRRIFSIGHGGLADLRQHAASSGHMRNVKEKSTRVTMNKFVVHLATPEADQVCDECFGFVFVFFNMGK